MSAAVAGRLSRSWATSLACKSTSAGGASGEASRRLGGSPSASLRRISESVPVPYIRCPLTHSNRTAPTAKRSLRRSSVSPIACSGDMYAVFPFDLSGARERIDRVHLRDAEVEELHVPLVRDHDVVRRDVPVNHVEERTGLRIAKLVRGVEPVARVGEHRRHERRRETTQLLARRSHDGRERLPLDVLHRQEELAVDLPEVECVHDVRMNELAARRASRRNASVCRRSRAIGGASVSARRSVRSPRRARATFSATSIVPIPPRPISNSGVVPRREVRRDGHPRVGP